MVRVPAVFACLIAAACAVAAEPVPADLRFASDLVIEGDDAVFLATVGSVVEDSHGNVYVGEAKQEFVLAYAPDGVFLRRMGGTGEGPGDLMQRFSLAIDARDRIWFAGMGGRVEIVATDWTPAASFARANPEGIARGQPGGTDGGRGGGQVNRSALARWSSNGLT